MEFKLLLNLHTLCTYTHAYLHIYFNHKQPLIHMCICTHTYAYTLIHIVLTKCCTFPCMHVRSLCVIIYILKLMYVAFTHIQCKVESRSFGKSEKRKGEAVCICICKQLPFIRFTRRIFHLTLYCIKATYISFNI